MESWKKNIEDHYEKLENEETISKKNEEEKTRE